MNKHNPVGWFEIPVHDMDRAQSFYEAVFNVALEPNEMDEYQMAWFPMIDDAIGSGGSLIKGDDYIPSHEGTVIYFSAPDSIIKTLERVKDGGGTVLAEKMSIGEHGFVAFFEDSEGNRIGLHSMQG